jgi:hypothetical protein
LVRRFTFKPRQVTALSAPLSDWKRQRATPFTQRFGWRGDSMQSGQRRDTT